MQFHCSWGLTFSYIVKKQSHTFTTSLFCKECALSFVTVASAFSILANSVVKFLGRHFLTLPYLLLFPDTLLRVRKLIATQDKYSFGGREKKRGNVLQYNIHWTP